MAAEQTLLEREGGGVAVLTLNRPEKRNALSRALREEIVARLDALEADEAVRAVVLTGAPPAFCAGFDRGELAGGAMGDVFADSVAYHRRVHTFPKPLIAAVRGAALGGGCDLAALCDFRIASTDAVFGQPQVRFGAPALYALMRSVMPAGPAREMCLTGRLYGAEEALALHLVNRVVGPEELLDTARHLAREIAGLPGDLPSVAKRSFLAEQPEILRD